MTGIEMGCDRSCNLVLSDSKEGAILEKQSIDIRIY
jgi:small nuclear ribonucleoprotein (snRNP)-like protein